MKTQPKILVSLIVAASSDGVIGNKNELPWNVPEDMKHFKQTTLLKPIIMGNTTFKSIGTLPNRFSIVLSHNPIQSSCSSVIYVDNIQTAISKAKTYCDVHNLEECVIIGGENIYNQTIDLVDKIYYTEIQKEVDGDAFFFFYKEKWVETDRVEGVSRNESVPYIISTFMRK